MKIEIPCADGTDRNCDGDVEAELPFTGLAHDCVEVRVVTRQGRRVLDSIVITPPDRTSWVTANQVPLTDEQKASIQKTGKFKFDADDVDEITCDACGSGSSGEDDHLNDDD